MAPSARASGDEIPTGSQVPPGAAGAAGTRLAGKGVAGTGAGRKRGQPRTHVLVLPAPREPGLRRDKSWDGPAGKTAQAMGHFRAHSGTLEDRLYGLAALDSALVWGGEAPYKRCLCTCPSRGAPGCKPEKL